MAPLATEFVHSKHYTIDLYLFTPFMSFELIPSTLQSSPSITSVLHAVLLVKLTKCLGDDMLPCKKV